MEKLAQLDIEAAVLETVREQMHAWVQRGEAAIEHFLTYVAADFTGFGTGPGDYVEDRDALRALTHREQAYLVYPFTLQEDWITVRVLHPSLALAEGEFDMQVHMEPKPIVLRVRASTLVAQRNDQWLVLHAHYSMPDAMQDNDGTLMDALKARNRELEREVARRTAELEQSLRDLKAMQAQLVQQEKMASLGALTAGVAHEIKNPLNFINNFAALSRDLADELSETSDPEEVTSILDHLKANAEKIEEHGQRADEIVRSMLELSRGSRSTQEAVALNALVEECVEQGAQSWQAQHPGFNVEVAQTLGATVGEVPVVRHELGRVLKHLLDNAFDAVHERAEQADAPYAPRVTVTTRCVDGQVEIRVADNGPGIPEARAANIFEPFYTTKPTGRGTGLGLSLCYDIITQGHKGTLTVASTEGEGATFTITLPRRPQGASEGH